MKKVIVCAVVLGLLVTAGLGYVTQQSSEIYDDTKSTLCAAFPGITNGFIKTQAGLPLRWQKLEPTTINVCAAVTDPHKVKIVEDYAKSWQFFMNWLIWSLPFFGLGYALRGRYAHYRN